MSPDVPAFKVRVFTSDFKFGIGVSLNDDISSKHSNSNLLTLLTLPYQFCGKYQLEERSVDNNMVSKI